MDRFATNVQPRLPRLARPGPIHNDFNIYNVLVDPRDHTRIAGVLDFGDMVHAPLIDDLAVAAAYQVDPAGDTMATLADFVAAYHAVPAAGSR
ncbi:phosphotransferase [Cupriavidus basilensis]